MFQNPLRRLKKQKMGIILFISLIVFTIVYTFYVSNLSYAVIFNGEEIGITKNKDEVNVIMESINEELDNRSGEVVDVNPEVTFEQVWGVNKEIDSIEDITMMAEKSIGLKAEAYVLNVDGKDKFYLYSEAEAKEILERLKTETLNMFEGINIKEISIIEDIEIKPKSVDSDDIIDIDTALQQIIEGTEQIRKYTVQQGNTASQIAVDFDVSLEDLEAANQDLNVNKLQIGQIVNLTLPKPLINVKVVEEKKYIESIPFGVKYEETSSMYKGDVKTSFTGREGKKEIKAEITYINGIKSDEKVIEENVLEEPASKVILKGTTPRPKTLAYGKFNSPTNGLGKITSMFGPRWGSYHKGVDIANPSGTTIVAADGGKVVFSGWKGDYGYIVIIDHENGYHSYYAHCSKLIAKKNDRVFRGQTIAKVGNTGNSTGPHLHFEIRKNGVPVDPLKYISN